MRSLPGKNTYVEAMHTRWGKGKRWNPNASILLPAFISPLAQFDASVNWSVHTRNCRRVGARFSWFVGAGRGRPLRCDFGNFVEPGREGLFLVFLSIWVRVGDDIAPAVSSDSTGFKDGADDPSRQPVAVSVLVGMVATNLNNLSDLEIINPGNKLWPTSGRVKRGMAKDGGVARGGFYRAVVITNSSCCAIACWYSRFAEGGTMTRRVSRRAGSGGAPKVGWQGRVGVAFWVPLGGHVE